MLMIRLIVNARTTEFLTQLNLEFINMGGIKRKITGQDKRKKAEEEARRLAEQQRIKNQNSAIMSSQGQSYESTGGFVNTGSGSTPTTRKRRGGGMSSSTSLGL